MKRIYLLILSILSLSNLFSQEKADASGDIVGSINGNFAVSSAGASTYSIPFECPEGFGGLNPGIALTYNSQSGDNIAGWGWGLSGLSAISVGAKSIFSDDAVSGISLTEKNKYSLDGNSLVLVSGEYGTKGSVYRLENDNFTRITITQESLLMFHYPLSFKVETKDGKIIVYSHLVNAKSAGNSIGISTPYQWLPVLITDQNGNFMRYIYENDPSYVSTRLSKIEYAGNTDNNIANASIEFVYQPKSVVRKTYFSGYYYENASLLRQIIVKSKYDSSEQILRKYELVYNTIGDYSFLKEITVANGEGTYWKGTSFEWGNDGTLISTRNFQIPNEPYMYNEITNRVYSAADIDGDGISELVEVYHLLEKRYEGDPGYSNYGDYAIVHKLKVENGKLDYSKDLWERYIGQSVDYGSIKHLHGGLLFVGLYGTFEKGIISPYYYLSNTKGKEMNFKNLKDGVVFSYPLKYSDKMTAYASGDINNDGYDEIISVEAVSAGTNNTDEGVIFYLRNTGYKSYQQVIDYLDMPSSICEPRDAIIQDIDGDGLADLLVVAKNGTYIFKNMGGQKGADGIVHVAFKFSKTLNMNTDMSWIKVGDFNGDGAPDFLINEHCTTVWKLVINKGNFDFDFTTISKFDMLEDGFTEKNDNKDDCIIIDFNHDGKSDIIMIDAKYKEKSDITGRWGEYDKTYITWYQSLGTSFEVVFFQNIYDENYTFKNHNTVGDFDGDGREDLFSYGSDLHGIAAKSEEGYFYTWFNKNFNHKQIKSITDGFGNKTEISYKPLTYSDLKSLDNNFYMKGDSAAYPMVDLNVPLYCVRNVTSPVGDVTSYSYSEATGHLMGKGFLGFKKLTSHNDQTDFTTSLTTEWDPAYAMPSYTEELVTASDGQMISQRVTSITNQKVDKLYRSKLSYVIENDGLKKQYKNTRYRAYDEYDNLKLVTEDYSGGITIALVNTYYNSPSTSSLYVIGQPLTQTRTIKTGTDKRVEKETFSYNSKRMLASQISTVNDYKLGETRWTYNNRGSLLSEKTFAYVSDTLQGKSYTYNSEELLLTSTNSIGQTTTYSQYNDWGKAGKIKDFRGNFTTYAFDGWGRNTSVSYPDGTTETFTLGAGTDGGFTQFNTATNESESRVYYDRLGREIATETQQMDGSWLRIDKTYDTKGNLYKVSLPHIGNSNVLWSTYTYDIYNRPISFVEASGKTTTWGYNGNSVTESLNKIATTRTYNALGQLIKVSDPSGTITYSLYADGRPSKIDASGVLTTFSYDNYDRQIELVDPSAGKRTMAYDNAGNIISETDAKGNLTKYGYDRYYRMTRKEVVGELVTNYVYNSISGLLESETSNNGTWTKYKYDALGRLIDEHKSAGTTEMNLRTLYTYNNGVVSEIAYSTEPIVNSQSRPIGVEKYEYSNGHLNKILWQDKAIWSASAINNSGQITTITTGPLMRKYQYDAYGLPTERQVTNTANRTIMQSFNYSFSPITGNLEWRKDRKHTSSENFLYDDFNRLKSFNGSTAAYDNKGNITNLSAVGSMTYSAAKPYAIESLTLSANSLQNTDQQSVSYNKMNLPSTITQGGKTATFTYNGSGERVRMSIPKPSTAGRIVGGFFDIHYYLGSKLEIIYDQSTKENKYIFYIGGDAYDAPAVSVQKGNLEWKTYYICRDYLGSITLITDASGNSVQELSYDAWGNLRDPLTYQVYACGKAPELFLGRGYTGHEHLSTFGLINMNARLYDPVVGRFLSPDPYVQMPDNLQNFNRYAYCLNNPLKYTDTSGKLFGIDDLFLVLGMAYLGGLQANFSNSGLNGSSPWNPVHWNWGSASTYLGIGSGIMQAAGASGYLPSIQIPGMIPNAALQAGIQVGINGIGNLINGGKFFDNWYWSAAMGALTGGAAGYDLSQESGLNNWWGSKVAYGRTQWSFINSELPMTTVNLNIEFAEATGSNTCVIQTMVELETSKGGTRTETDFKESTRWTDDGVELPDGGLKELLNQEGFDNKATSEDFFQSPSNGQTLSERGNSVVILHDDQSNIQHATTIKRINYYQSGKVKLYGRGRTYTLKRLRDKNPSFFIIN